jgi:YidC/Oxa1 family membrane protein insertase
MQNKRTIVAVALFVVFIGLWYLAKIYFFPTREQPANSQPAVTQTEREARRPAAVAAAGPFINQVPEPERIDRPIRHPAQKIVLGAQANMIPAVVAAQRKKDTRQITLGDKDPTSKYHLQVVLDALGGTVRSVLLNKFQAVDEMGQPMWENPKTQRIRKLLELVPDDPNGTLSYALYHFDRHTADKDKAGDQPLDTLGNIEWTVVSPKEGEEVGAGPEQAVVFEAHIAGVVIQKKYTLKEGEYHLGLEVRMFKEKPSDTRDWFRYQLAGAHGLPVEGRWYTSIFRNALIAQVDKSNNAVYRDLQDLRTLSVKEGGDEVERTEGRFIRYAAVAIQYFTSAIVVDDTQEKQDFLSRARPTLETGAVKGTVKSLAAGGSSFVLTVGEKERAFHVDESALRQLVPPPNVPLGVIYRTVPTTDGKGRDVVLRLNVGNEAAKTQPFWEDDITVRVSTEPINLKDATDEQHAVVHKYLIYNGPMKPMLLGQEKEPNIVSEELVRRYSDKLNLNTLVDYSSPGWAGSIAGPIGWTWLLVHTTNLMHLILHLFSWIGLPPALCIVLLTVLVRGMMFPISRKAAMTNIKMQELQPEIKKLKEKHQGDPQALNMAVWQLQRKSGVNPLSTCWLMFLQMPIFMGLYFALQESIHFRAAAFWPTWIHNLAAPDMLFKWGESIPFISAVESYGSFIYLGPFLNILPVIAVTLMIFQQKYTMPPPTDEQQEMQQKMMKYMMVFMGLMFYKVPSGLVLYFIASSVWGFCERKLLPKKKPTTSTGEPIKESFLQTLLSRPAASKEGQTAITTAPAVTTGNGAPKADGKGRNRVKPGKGKRKSERGGQVVQATDANGSMLDRLRTWWRQRQERMNDWWQKIRDEAQKKNR